jgi:hypothetical protein
VLPAVRMARGLASPGTQTASTTTDLPKDWNLR